MDATAPVEQLDLVIEGMTCAACAARVEKSLNKLAGVDAAVNLAAERAHVRFPASTVTPSELITAVEQAGYGASLVVAASRDAERARKDSAFREELTLFWWSAILTAPLALQMVPMLWGSGHVDGECMAVDGGAGNAGRARRCRRGCAALLDRFAFVPAHAASGCGRIAAT